MSKYDDFVREYVYGVHAGNAQKSWEAAGGTIGSNYPPKLMKRPDVQQAIREAQQARAAALASRAATHIYRDIATAEEQEEFLTKVMRGEIQDEIVLQSGEVVKIPARIEIRIKAAEQLGRRHGALEPGGRQSNISISVGTRIAQLAQSEKLPIIAPVIDSTPVEISIPELNTPK